ncbi:hypothetical protein HMPREF9443_00146 [Phascolarctobacterium succinatutens YIT 12067]|uniref:Uncharacterized protein n=1 Tax=Phascolarctobacterium succinatutens YIT 12067 TaxID=626939 RepID=E8LBD5_9FIRM|nr:hypothetical protein HMPREF9443_00146 [Phascolarctobacterium succinatutens YIT 12067]
MFLAYIINVANLIEAELNKLRKIKKLLLVKYAYVIMLSI